VSQRIDRHQIIVEVCLNSGSLLGEPDVLDTPPVTVV
jgi:hypothetical protein